MKKKIILTILIIFLCCIAIGLILYAYFSNRPFLALNGEKIVQVNLDSQYKEEGAKAYVHQKEYSTPIQMTGEVDSSKIGSYCIEYSFLYQDKTYTKKRTIEVIDHVFPTITLKGNEEITIALESQYLDEGCIAEDNYDGDITNKVHITGKVNTATAGTYYLTYQVEDSSGNKTEAKRKIIVSTQKKTIPTANNTASKLASTASKEKGLPVLMYHFFYDAKAGEKGKDNNFMEVSDFEAQMKYLSDYNWYFPSWTEVEAYIDKRISLPSNSIVITVDDGDESFLRLAIPIIEKYKIKVTSFLVSSWNGDWVPKQYQSSKIDFQSHSHDMHRAGKNEKGVFLTLSSEKSLEDVTTSKRIIGGNVTVFCYPFGHYSDATKSILKEAGYRLAFTTKGGRVCPGADKFALPRVRMSKGDSLSAFKNKIGL